MAGAADQCGESAAQAADLNPSRRFTVAPGRRGMQHMINIGVSDPAVALAVHPGTREVFVGTRHGSIALLDSRSQTERLQNSAS